MTVSEIGPDGAEYFDFLHGRGVVCFAKVEEFWQVTLRARGETESEVFLGRGQHWVEIDSRNAKRTCSGRIVDELNFVVSELALRLVEAKKAARAA